MEPSSEGKQLLGRMVRARRKHLGLSQEKIAEIGGPSTATLYLIESGQAPRMQRATIENLELVLDWPRGMIDKLLTDPPPSAEEQQQLTRLPSESETGSGLGPGRAFLLPPNMPENVEITIERGEPYMLVTEVTTREGLEATRRAVQYMVDTYQSELRPLEDEIARYRDQHASAIAAAAAANAAAEASLRRRDAVMHHLGEASAVLAIIADKQAALERETGSVPADGSDAERQRQSGGKRAV